MRKFFILALLLTLAGGNTAFAENQSCVTDDGKPGTSTDGGPCVEIPASNNSDGFQALAPIPGLTGSGNSGAVDPGDFAAFFNNLYKYLIGIAAILAVIQIIRGGLEISTQDSVSKQSAGKEHIRDAIFGLVLVLAPVLVFTIINPKILDLSLNLPALETSTSQPNDDDDDEEEEEETECTVTGSVDNLQVADCPTPAATEAQANLCPHAGVIKETKTELNGQPVASIVVCNPQREYVFIDTNPSWSTIFNAINYLKPMAKAGSDENNAAGALQFASTCAAAGRSTCLDPRQIPTPFTAETCNPLATKPYPSGATGKCHTYKLTCDNSAGVLETLASYCDSNPDWEAWP